LSSTISLIRSALSRTNVPSRRSANTPILVTPHNVALNEGCTPVVLEARRARSAPLHWRITDSHHCHWIRDNGMALRQEEPLVKNLGFSSVGDAMCQKELPASAQLRRRWLKSSSAITSAKSSKSEATRSGRSCSPTARTTPRNIAPSYLT